MVKDFRGGKTSVFWDVEDFPIPEGRRIPDIIASVLSRIDYVGEVSFKVYGESETNPFPGEENLTFVHKRTKYWRLNKMLVDIGLWAVDNPEPHYIPTNLMVVAKNIKEDTEFLPMLEGMNSSHFNVLLVVPDDCQPEEVPLPTVNIVWRWGCLLAGGMPIPKADLRALINRGDPKKRGCIFIVQQEDDVLFEEN